MYDIKDEKGMVESGPKVLTRLMLPIQHRQWITAQGCNMSEYVSMLIARDMHYFDLEMELLELLGELKDDLNCEYIS